jgi:hypothetical protein
MPNVVLSATPIATRGEIMLVELQAVTQDEDWVGLYSQLQFFRSTQGPSGPWEELTAPTWTRPRLPAGAGDAPVDPVTGPALFIVNAELVLVNNGQTRTITFTGSDPLTTAQAAAQVVSQGGGLFDAHVAENGQFVVEATLPGLQSQLMVLPSDGSIILGFSTTEPGNTATGRDVRLGLVEGTTTYPLIDYFGSRDYYYRTRYFDPLTGAQSEPSAVFQVGTPLPPEDIVIGWVSMVDGRGVPMSYEVRVYTESSGGPVDAFVVVGSTQVARGDENGRAEFRLLRGQRVSVSIQGTNLVRTLTVPIDPDVTSFNLLGSDVGPFDVYRAAVPELITAERRTL